MQEIKIYCPDCGRKVMTHDGKGTIPISNLCKKCKKIITYIPNIEDPKQGKITSKSKGKYISSGGKRVY